MRAMARKLVRICLWCLYLFFIFKIDIFHDCQVAFRVQRFAVVVV